MDRARSSCSSQFCKLHIDAVAQKKVKDVILLQRSIFEDLENMRSKPHFFWKNRVLENEV